MRRSSQLLSTATANRLIAHVPTRNLQKQIMTEIASDSISDPSMAGVAIRALLIRVALMYFLFGQLRTFSWLMFR
jgi:hypothetical protein